MTRLPRAHVSLAVAAVLGAASGLALAAATPPEHRATAWVEVSPAIFSPAIFGEATVESVAAAKSLARGQVHLVTALSVLKPAMDRLSWADAETFRERLEVAWIPDTSILMVSFRDADPARATWAANALAESFVERSESLQSEAWVGGAGEFEAQIGTIQAEVRALNLDVERGRAQLGPSPQPGMSLSPARALVQAQLSQLELSRQMKEQTLDQLQRAADDLGLARLGPPSVRIAQTARLDQESDVPRPLLEGLLGALLGILLTVAVMVYARFLDRGARRLRQAAATLGVESLGALRQLHRPSGPGLFLRECASSPEADDIRALRLNLLAAGDATRSLLVTSALPREGRSLVAANLALASAEAGTLTILVDADVRHPSQNRNFDVNPDFGLMELLAEPTSTLKSLPRFQIADRLFVIPVGRDRPATRETLSRAAFDAVVHDMLAGTCGFVIVDGPPLLGRAETLTMARACEGTLLIADPARSRSHDIRRALQLLQQVHGKVLGLFLDHVDRQTLDPLPRPASLARRAETSNPARRAKSNLARWLLLLWAALLGVQFGQDVIPHFNIALSDFALGALLLVVLVDPQLRRRALAMPGTLAWFFAAMACAIALGSLVDALTLGFVPREGWLNKGVGLGVLAAAAACVRAVAPTRESIHALLRALLFGAIASAGLGMLLFLGVYPLAGFFREREVRFAGFLLDPNAAGLYYTVGLLLTFACIGGAPFGLGKRTRIAGAALLGIATIVTISLSSLVAGLVSFGVLVAGLPGRRWPAAVVFVTVLLVTVPFLNAAVAPATIEGDVFEQAATARSTLAAPSLVGDPLTAIVGSSAASAVAIKGRSTFDRLAVLTLAFELWSSDLWSIVFGIGLGAFAVYANESQLAAVVIIHNTYLWLLIELGIMGLAALVSLLWYIASVSIELLRFADRPTAVALLASIVVLLVWWQFNEGLYQRVFWLLLPAAGVLAELARRTPSRSPAHPPALATSALRA